MTELHPIDPYALSCSAKSDGKFYPHYMITPMGLLPDHFHPGRIKTPEEALDTPKKKPWQLADHWAFIP